MLRIRGFVIIYYIVESEGIIVYDNYNITYMCVIYLYESKSPCISILL